MGATNMKALYLNLDRDLIGAPDFLRAEHYEVVEVASFGGALKLIEVHELDVVLIDNCENLKTVDFIIDVRRLRPYLPIFVVSAWGPNLVLALRCLGTAHHVEAA